MMFSCTCGAFTSTTWPRVGYAFSSATPSNVLAALPTQLNTTLVFAERNAALSDGRRRCRNGIEPCAGDLSRSWRCWRCAGALIVMVVKVIPNTTPAGRRSGLRMTSCGNTISHRSALGGWRLASHIFQVRLHALYFLWVRRPVPILCRLCLLEELRLDASVFNELPHGEIPGSVPSQSIRVIARYCGKIGSSPGHVSPSASRALVAITYQGDV